jgi:hypothetical protein
MVRSYPGNPVRETASNQALKLTRLSACQLRGPAFAQERAARRPCTSSAVQLNAGVGCENEGFVVDYQDARGAPSRGLTPSLAFGLWPIEWRLPTAANSLQKGKPMKGNLVLKLYLAISGTIFLFVGLLHLLRLIYHWPIVVGTSTIPQFLSYVGFPVATGYAVWAFWLLRK